MLSGRFQEVEHLEPGINPAWIVVQGQFEDLLTAANIRFRLVLPHADGEGLAWAYRHAQVLGRADRAKGVELTLAIDPKDVEITCVKDGFKLQRTVRRQALGDTISTVEVDCLMVKP